MNLVTKHGIARLGLLLALAGVAAGPVLVHQARHCRAARAERQVQENLRKLWADMCEGWPRRFTDPQGRRGALADLRPGVTVTEANFSRVPWERADLRGIRLLRCNLTAANLDGADLRGVDLGGCV